MFVGVKCHSYKEAWADPEESGTHTPPPENSNSLSNVEAEIFFEDLILLF